MTDGLLAGWNAATYALGWALGALIPIALLALVLGVLVWALGALTVDVPHWLTVRRLHREAHRSGRAAARESDRRAHAQRRGVAP